MSETRSDSDVMERLASEVLARLENGAEGPRIRYVGDYELEEEIARGGMGVVYRARQTSLGRAVALKMILTGRFASEEEVARFQFEAEAAAGLSHPGIVAIHEVGIHEGQHYFSMEYVEGRSLERIGNGAPIAMRTAAEYALAIAEAVEYAHERGVLHRDLKPSNVLLDRTGRVRITDFGIAKRGKDANQLTGTGQILGTPGYMAPEQACGRASGPAADVYSIGAILYELLTGRAPFVGETPLAVLLQARDSEPLPPSVLNDRVPADLATIALTALERSQAKRYPSARALADDLLRYLDKEPIHAQGAGRVRRLAAWGERHPWTIATALTGVALVLCCLAYGLWAETERLRWMVAHPAAESIPWTRPEDVWTEWWSLVYLALVFLPADVIRRSSGLTMKQFRDRRLPRVLGHRRVPAALLAVYGAVLLVALAFATALTKSAIDEIVWTHDTRFMSAGGMIVLWFALPCLLHVGREARATLHGVPARTYTAEEADGHVDALVVLIQRYVRIRKTGEAEELIELLRSLYPDRPEWMEMRGELHAAREEAIEAARDFEMAARRAELIGGYTDAFVEKLERRARESESGAD